MSTDTGRIYTGSWVNHAKGSITGATLTLSSSQGAFLVAFLGVFITLVGSQFWVLVSFALHQLNCTKTYDGLQKQHQVILRNSGTSAGAAYELLRLPFYWWRREDQTQRIEDARLWPFLRRSWVLSLFPLLSFALFAGAGVLSSQVTKAAGDELLVSGSNCGQWNFNPQAPMSSYVEKSQNESQIAYNYARECYGGSVSSTTCNTYMHQQLKWSEDRNANCPFESGMCLLGDTAALKLDTGYIDSHTVLGINSPKRDRIDYRRVTTCAPLNTSGRIQPNKISGTSIIYYDYDFGPTSSSNVTWTYFEVFSSLGGLLYSLDQWANEAGVANQSWFPDPGLAQADADITLFAMSANNVAYIDPVTDPFFQATHQVQVQTSTGTQLYYKANDYDEFVHFASCVDQHQLCDPNIKPPKCTALHGWMTLQAAILNFAWTTPRQLATALRIQQVLQYSSMFYTTSGRGGLVLRASEKVSQIISAGLPSNQWMIEMSDLFAMALARLQHGIVEYATGPTDITEGMIVQGPSDSEGQALCSAQMVRNTGLYSNFSILGLSLIVGIGTVIIIASIFVESIVDVFRRRRRYSTVNNSVDKSQQWVLDGKFQLMRLAYEGIGVGTWVRTGEHVPVVKEGGQKIFSAFEKSGGA
ncbi:uncharacterized protein Z520_04598 [Fonsecaea multimorphosa CBS 102226]|uniref:Uncharacterized protein n=1 Tax=Fonsecaea multimorphosa CBS 102226 TaxID=1442371 RepID=A0A0D2HDJ7_9EURO|nr:uncharacterized protein Z520_04598 [Fonsecaea multimorphosa CBS 102226]KIX99960.1 hypothetical protein Z520_04598 [Fonsecaea multimorphosa CBS 102226]